MNQRGIDLRFPQGLVLDRDTREMFEILRKFLRGHPLLNFRGRLMELSSPVAVTNAKINHGLNFRPLDVVVASKTTGTLTFDYENFTETDIIYTIGAGVSARVLVGSFGDT